MLKSLINRKEQTRILSVGIHTLGCRLNQYESDGIIQRFVDSGAYSPLPIEQGPDIAILNTCTVTEQADARNRNLIRRILKKNPSSKIIVTGCYAQTNANQLQLPGVSLIIGNDRKSSLFEIVEQTLSSTTSSKPKSEDKPRLTVAPNILNRKDERISQPAVKTDEPTHSILPKLHAPFAYGKVRPYERTRAYLKIQDGCDKKCSYCKIPLARGKSVSRPHHEILEHVHYLDDIGVPEIVLTGINLGWYRDRTANLRFIGLLEKILSSLQYARLRLSSIEPCDVAAPLAEISQHPRFCDFLHVPLQSGSTKILRVMRRSYSPYSFRKRLETVLRYRPDIFLGTDVIVGFPGETEQDFWETMQLCKELGISGIHGFRFSLRSGTAIANSQIEQTIPIHITRQRMEKLQELRAELWQGYVERQLGTRRQAILEKITRDGFGEALTDNYLRVIFPIPEKVRLDKGQFLTVKLQEGVGDYRVRGILSCKE